MIHNRIEYGLMAVAEAEHLNILSHASVEKRGRAIDAETMPLRNPEHYLYDFNLTDITGVRRRRSSWLLDLTGINVVDGQTFDETGNPNHTLLYEVAFIWLLKALEVRYPHPQPPQPLSLRERVAKGRVRDRSTQCILLFAWY